MTLSQEQIDTLVKNLERYARKQPEGYRLRVMLLVLLGYAYIVVMLGGLAIILLAFLAIPYAVMVLAGLGSLFLVRIPPPKGVQLDRARYPKLFAEIDRLCVTFNAPKPHEVLLTDDLNAAVLQAPKFGLATWYTNYLLLGLPLMQIASPGQFRATLAHEMGHLAGNHSRFSGWVYRVRRAWAMLAAQQGDRPSFLLYPFFKWYEPFFRAYSFVLSRNDEYFADRCAAEYAGRQNAAEDLIQIYVQGAHATTIWQGIYEQASRQAHPPDDAVTTLLKRLQTQVPPEQGETWLEMALARQTDTDDTHPCLAERLAAYSYRYIQGKHPPVPFVVNQTAANYFLGDDIDWAIALLNAQWKVEHSSTWKQQYERVQLRSRFHQQLLERSQSEPLSLEATLKLAMLTAEFDSPAAAFPQLQAVLEQTPKHPMANFQMGQILLEQENGEGIDYLATAIQQEPILLIYSFESLYAALQRQGRQAEAQTYQAQFRQLFPDWQRAQQERSDITEGGQFIPHGLPLREIQQTIWQLSRYPEVREAYLVQRIVKYLPESRCYVLGLVSQFNHHSPMSSLQSWELTDIVNHTLCLSEDVRVIPLNERRRGLYQALRKTAGAKII